jgi:histidine ammonia-lyase
MSTTTKSIERKTSPKPVLLNGNGLSLEEVELVASGGATVSLAPEGTAQLNASRAIVDRIIDEQQVVYGITTGFGKFKDINISRENTELLQHNLMLSHSAGVGVPFSKEITRAIMLLRANALVKGFSGIRVEVVQMLLDMLNGGIHPVIPCQGSVGASGDLAPLAHLGLALIGKGESEVDGQVKSSEHALKDKGLKPVALQAKEGLALINGTQVMSGLGTLIVLEAERLAKIADILGAMSIEALMGSRQPFHETIQQIRPHPGQIASARNLWHLLENSSLMESHINCPMVQDAYSLRCMPQVHGASRQAFAHARSVLEIEINSATDNPLVFQDAVRVGGNFHGQPLALVMDYVAMALSELANISERRTERLVNPALSNGLPAFLTSIGGLNSGLMIAQYTAAALVSENKSLAHPASVDSIPTCANQEDHVSMGTISVRKAEKILHNVRNVLAIELLCATQGLDFRLGAYDIPKGETRVICSDTCGLTAGQGAEIAHKYVRTRIPHLYEDRESYKDIAEAERIITSGDLLSAVEARVGRLA